MPTFQEYAGSIPDIRTSHTAIGGGSKGDWLFIDSNTGSVTAIPEMTCPNSFHDDYLPNYTHCCEIDSTHVFVIYNMYYKNDYYICARVLTIEGDNTYTANGPLYVWSYDTKGYMDCCLADTNKVVVAYRDDYDVNKGKAFVAAISGDKITFGPTSQFTARKAGRYQCGIDLCKIDTGKVFISYADLAAPYYGHAVVGNISDTTNGDNDIIFGSETQFSPGTVTPLYPRCCPLDTDKAVITYRKAPSPYDPSAIVATISGTTITFGTAQTWENTAASTVCYYVAPVQLETDKFFVAWSRGSVGYGYSIIVDVSDSTCSFSDKVAFDETGNLSNYFLTAFLVDTDKVAVVYKIGVIGHRCIIATISGTVPTFGDSTLFTYNAAGLVSTYPAWACSYDTDKICFVFSEYSAVKNYRGVTRVGSVSGTDLSLPNYRYTGIAAHDFTDSTSVEVIHSGILSGITKPGMDKYFLLDKTEDMIIPATARKDDMGVKFVGYDIVPGTRAVFLRGYVSLED